MMASLWLTGIMMTMALSVVVEAGTYWDPVSYTELSSSVITFHSSDLYVTYSNSQPQVPQSLCIDMVNRADGFNGQRLQFVFTHRWMPPAGKPTSIAYFCANSATISGCTEWTNATIALVQEGYRQCFLAAIKKGFTTLVINPHIDDASGQGTWRNYVAFDPLYVYSKWNYRDAMLAPIARALAEAINPTTQVFFQLQGEMGATLFTAPWNWLTLVPWVKQMVGGTKTTVGIAMNWSIVKGGVTNVDVTNTVKLFQGVDFFGISCYAPLPVAITPAALENGAKNFQNELSGIINVQNLIALPGRGGWGKKFIYTEYGVGGGANDYGNAPATTVAQAVARPDRGYFSLYQTSMDPWHSWLPATASYALRDWNRAFYNATYTYLKNNGGPNYRVDALFLWSTVSYDVQTIGPLSSSSQGSYWDSVIVQGIRNHNWNCYHPSPS